jgi:hypothetical protein
MKGCRTILHETVQNGPLQVPGLLPDLVPLLDRLGQGIAVHECWSLGTAWN